MAVLEQFPANYAPDADRELIAAGGNTARAEVRRRSPDKIFHDGLAFVDDGTGRKIVNNVTRLEAVWLAGAPVGELAQESDAFVEL